MFRVIIFGRIEFKNQRSIHHARAGYIRNNDTKAKNDLIFRPEALFGEELEEDLDSLHLEFARTTYDAGAKTLQATLDALGVLMQFAIAGRVDVFVLEAGELPQQRVLEVDNDKSIVHAFNAGMEALNEKRYADAVAPLTDAIDGFPRHAWALNARGLARYELGDLDAAEADFKAARKLYPALPSPHLGLAKIAHRRGERAATIDNCERAMNGSIPHQPGYWISALFKAQVLLDVVEQGGTTSPEERRSYLSIARVLLERYEAKLRQLGDAKSELYPDRSELDALRERYEAIAEGAAARA